MVIANGEKVFVMTRRQFDTDLRRHFAGVVEESGGGLIRARGYVFNFDQAINEFVRRKDKRTRIFGIGDAGLIINVLPESVDLKSLHHKMDANGLRMLSDDHGFEMNISEFGASR